MVIRKALASVALAAVIACIVPPLVFARGTEKKAPENKAGLTPRPDVAKKVYTNDDLGWRSATPAPVRERQSGQTGGTFSLAGSPSTPAVGVLASSYAELSPAPFVQPASLDPAQDPKWYAGQLAQMEAQLAGVENEEARLQDFRASGSTQGQATGLVLNAPCEGITTDNLIVQLGTRREELNQQIDDLNNMASASGVSPAAIAQVAAVQLQPTPEELATRYRQLSAQLDETQAIAEDMQQQAASQGITLQPPTPGAGGNMTTDLQSRLAARADSLQNQLSGTEGDALSIGVPPGDLR